jgi:hypothetical protein
MSFPYPQDRHRDRKEKGEHPYKDAKETLARERAEVENEAHEAAEERPRTSSLSEGGEDIPREVIDSMRRAGESIQDDNAEHRN